MENTEIYKGIKIVRFKYRGYPAVQIFNGKTGKMYIRRYGSSKQIEALIANYKAEEDKREAEANFKKTYMPKMKAGDILVSSWGYEQTNIDYYQVIRVSGMRAYLRKIGKRHVAGEGSMREDAVMPSKDDFCGEKFFKRICVSLYGVSASEYVNINSYSIAWPWDGKVNYETNSIYGH